MKRPLPLLHVSRALIVDLRLTWMTSWAPAIYRKGLGMVGLGHDYNRRKCGSYETINGEGGRGASYRTNRIQFVTSIFLSRAPEKLSNSYL